MPDFNALPDNQREAAYTEYLANNLAAGDVLAAWLGTDEDGHVFGHCSVKQVRAADMTVVMQVSQSAQHVCFSISHIAYTACCALDCG